MIFLKAFHSIWAIISPQKRSEARIVIFLSVGALIFELIGIGIFLPALAFLGNQRTDISSGPIGALQKFLGINSTPAMIVVMLGIIIIVITIKTCFLMAASRRTAKFIFGLQGELTSQLFRSYLHQEYIFHTQRSSAELIRNIFEEVALTIGTVFKTLIVLFSDILTLTAFGIFIILYEPTASLLTVVILVVPAFIIYRLLASRMKAYAKDRQIAAEQRLKLLQQGLNGIKEIKIKRQENNVVKYFDKINKKYTNAGQHHMYLGSLPRLWMELIAVFGFVLLVGILLGLGRSAEIILPFMGLFVIAVLRVVPAISRVASGLQTITYGMPAVDTVCNELQTMSEVSDENSVSGSSISKPVLQDKIEIRNVSFKYPQADKEALTGINLEIRRGESIGIIGSSGSGKTTLADVLLGLLTPSKGDVLCDGDNINIDLKNWQSQLGYVPQRIYMLDDTLQNNIIFSFGEDSYDAAKLTYAVKAAKLDKFVNELSEGLNTQAGEGGVKLSGGEMQRVGIARALYQDPELLVLDEATSSLDPETEQLVMEAVDELRGEKTVVIIAHKQAILHKCNRVIRIEKGRIISDDVDLELSPELQAKS